MRRNDTSHTFESTDERVILAYTNTDPAEDEYAAEELRSLANTLGYLVVGEVRQRVDRPNPHTYFGEGKVEELADEVAERGADCVIVDAEISARQQHNLEEALRCPVVDRPRMILEIFARRAHSAEGVLQVELAQHIYWLPRLMSRYTRFERQRGGTGTRGGGGEQQLEQDRRRVRDRITALKAELEEVRRKRQAQRDSRRRYPFPFAVLVGYTCAGKSTLLNTLSGSSVWVGAEMFSTLDPTTRRVALPDGYSVFITDTVGFLRNLPTQLIAAFHATLEEVTFADLLIHVIDVSHPYWELQRDAVYDTLAELDALNKPIVTAFNKCDQVKDHHRLVELVAETPCSAYISAKDAVGINHLTDRLVAAVRSLLQPVEVLIPYAQSHLVAECYEMGRVLDARYLPEGIRVSAEVVEGMAARLSPYRLT